jgi:prevent-host-death family protein
LNAAPKIEPANPDDQLDHEQTSRVPVVVSLTHAKTHLSALIRQACAGEEVLITKRGQVVAKLSAAGIQRRVFALQQGALTEQQAHEATRLLEGHELEGRE